MCLFSCKGLNKVKELSEEVVALKRQLNVLYTSIDLLNKRMGNMEETKKYTGYRAHPTTKELEQQIEIVGKKLKAGYTVHSIAQEMGLPTHIIYHRAQRYRSMVQPKGEQKRSAAVSSDVARKQMLQIIELYKKELSGPRIARELRLDEKVVHNRIKKARKLGLLPQSQAFKGVDVENK